TWTATDDVGNSASCDQIITIIDTQDPVIICPADITTECNASIDPSNTGSATATDVCDPAPVINYTDTPDLSGCGGYTGTITRTWTATDACGNSASCDQIITLVDRHDPQVFCPADLTIQCDASTDPSNTGTATAADICDPNPAITYADTPDWSGCGGYTGTITRTWTATDACDNSASCDQIITIIDTQDPVITCPPPITIECNASTDPSNTGNATATDICDPAPVITYSDTPNGGGIIRTWTATDACGNDASCDQVITIDDTEDPAITCPADLTIQCDESTDPSHTGTATAIDNCDPDPGITYVDTPDWSGCGGYTGTITRTWTATDDVGNSASCDQIITIIDTQDPVITCPADITIQCNASTDPANTGSATATDVCNPALVIIWVDTPDMSGCGGYTGTITRTWTATDPCGNYSASCDQIITVIDTQDPVVTCPADVTIQCDESTDPANTGSATATDICDPAPAITYADTPDMSACGGYTGTITRTWTATDDCGNSASCDQIITVIDTQDPVITCPADIAVACNGSTHPDDTGYPTVTDQCDQAPQISYADTQNGSTITRVWTAEDACGNSASCSQTITAGDTEPPVIYCPANATVECDESTDPSQAGFATATDNCDPDPDITYADTPNMNGCGGYTGTITRIWTATDASSNSVSCVQTITIVDNTSPVVTCPALKIFSCDDVGDFGVATATDNCDPYPSVGIISRDSTPGSVPEAYTLVLTWEATDDCGNSDQCQQTIIVDCAPTGCCMDLSIGPPGGGGARPGIVEALNGTQVTVPVTISNPDSELELGGFDFLLCYDPTVLSISGVQAGEGIADWEYFTYRLSADDNCGGSCPTGQIRLLAIAELDNGYPIPEAAFTPVGVIVNLVFRVTSDRNFIGQCVPINFCWYDCADNTVASRTGDTTFVDAVIYGDWFPLLLWDEDDDDQFPEDARPQGLGAPDDCLGLSGPDKPDPIRCIRFFNGKVCIIEPPDDRGDLNLNGIANEVGDAVLYTNYFIYGEDVFEIDANLRAVQTLASDVNNDGVVLTVADLIYLIRVLTGDAVPYPPGGNPKLAPYASTAAVDCRVESGVATVSTQSSVALGGGLFVLRYTDVGVGQAVLSDEAAGMTIRSASHRGELRVLVTPDYTTMTSVNAGRRDLFTVPLAGSGRIELVATELADAEGGLMTVQSAGAGRPENFALYQNYPNPFNAGTVIPFDLESESDWSVQIYNVAGQVIRTLTGHDAGGRTLVTWDGTSQDGRRMASGIYFYRITAGDFTTVRKMTLLK
ncbi:MAG TPA: T9SS type A sorting domain-containing protein, partial [Acidobacteriota bacterium]|nr:T9SS type A sorting domain-containing protein [Acidobacteriota bacterium]